MKLAKGELKQAQEFVDNNLDRIVEWTVGDIKRCCRIKDDGICEDGGALVGAFILWCCAIDYYGGLYTGLTAPRATLSRFKGFVHKYMSRYDAIKLADLRWALLHYYSVRHFALYHQNDLEQNKELHLSPSTAGILLHLGTSVIDLENAVKQYCKDLKADDNLKVKMWRYNKEIYPLMPIKVELIIKPNTFNSLPSGITFQNIAASGTVGPDEWFKK